MGVDGEMGMDGEMGVNGEMGVDGEMGGDGGLGVRRPSESMSPMMMVRSWSGIT